jgi:hypothetical protein
MSRKIITTVAAPDRIHGNAGVLKQQNNYGG